MPLPITPAPSTPMRCCSATVRSSPLAASSFRGVESVSGLVELESSQPEPGRLELGARRWDPRRLPEPIQRLRPRAFDHPGRERGADLVVLPLERQAEQLLDEPARLAPLDAMPGQRLVHPRVRRDEPATD